MKADSSVEASRTSNSDSVWQPRTRPNGHVWQFAYDAANRLSHTTNPEFTPADPHVATRQYNAAGQLISRTDYLGQTITQSYNADGQLAEIIYPDASKVRYDWTCCRLSRMVDATGTSLFTYDLANRLVSAVDANRHMVAYQYNANGQPTRVLLPDGRAVERTYSELGKVAGIIDGDARTSAFGYIAASGGQLEDLDFMGQVAIGFTYNALGLLTAATGDAVETYTRVDTAYPTASPLNVSSTIGGDDFTDTLTARTDMRLLTELHESDPPGTPDPYFQKAYDYDRTGNLTTSNNLVPDPDAPTHTWLTTETYSNANFLRQLYTAPDPVFTSEDYDYQQPSPTKVLTDRNGNIKQIIKQCVKYVEVVIETVPTMVPEYFLFTWNFTFDPENRLIQAHGYNSDTDETTILTFAYDGLGRRVLTSENGIGHWYVYDGDQLIQDRNDKTDALIVEYTYGPTPTGPSAIFKQNRGGQERFFYTSPQGGFPRYAFDDTGTLTDWLQYSAFGELVFHEASGTATEIEVGCKGWRYLGSETPLPLATIVAGPFFLLPELRVLGQGVAGAMLKIGATPYPFDPGGGGPPEYPPNPGQPSAGEISAIRNCCQDDPTHTRGSNPNREGNVCANSKITTKKPIVPKPSPKGPWAPETREHCYHCIQTMVKYAEIAMAFIVFLHSIPAPQPGNPLHRVVDPNCGGLYECLLKGLRIAKRAPDSDARLRILCGYHAQPEDFGCTSCTNYPGGPLIMVNCGVTSRPETLLHELMHWCRSCGTLGNNRPLKPAGIDWDTWDIATTCQWHKCNEQCIGGGYYRWVWPKLPDVMHAGTCNDCPNLDMDCSGNFRCKSITGAGGGSTSPITPSPLPLPSEEV